MGAQQHVRMRLHEDARLALVGLAQILASFYRLGTAGVEVVGLANADHAGARVWFVKRGNRIVRLRDVTI